MAGAASPGLPIDEKRELDEPVQGGERALKDPVYDTMPVMRNDSMLHVGKTSQMGDLSEQVRDSPSTVKKTGE